MSAPEHDEPDKPTQQIAAGPARRLPVRLLSTKGGIFPAFFVFRACLHPAGRFYKAGLAGQPGSHSMPTWPGSFSTRFSQAATAG